MLLALQSILVIQIYDNILYKHFNFSICEIRILKKVN
jgi:hypothetical protein